MTKSEFIQQINEWGKEGVPFLFITDFELENLWAKRQDALDEKEVKFFLNGVTNNTEPFSGKNVKLEKHPIPFEEYKAKFDFIQDQLRAGNSYLVNLTVRTPITLNVDLKEVFLSTTAPYKLWLNNKLVLFSPECFIKITDGKIHTYPMKGTLPGSPGAGELLLADQKEKREHTTIVDLLRNDLARVADHVTVKKYRYLEEIKTNNGKLLQVSSEIVGELSENYASYMGNILFTLLPAGSISGAPKPKTIEIIQQVEKERRGYYTGVFGYFDGKNLDSAVMIRYIEKEKEACYYRSGGGLTAQSICQKEYQEIIDKIYVPTI